KEHQPITSQPTRVSTTSWESTTSSIAPVNSDTVAANCRYLGSYQRYHRAKTCTTSATTATTTATSALSRPATSSRGTLTSPSGRAPIVPETWGPDAPTSP